ncbi:MAG: hypothetical protein JSR77_08305 [Planctomycetes bacterium]|nr:hypothetical protein [Planctomycetota bacterium]
MQTTLTVGEPPHVHDPLPPTGVEDELEEIRPGLAIKKKFDELAAKTNLRIGFAQSFLFQQASGGPGDRNAGGGDIDLLAKWTAIGAGTKDTGIVAFAGEYRFQIGDQPPSALGPEIGTLLPTTNGFSERPPVVKELYWDHRLFEDHFRYVVGRVDPENLFGGHRLQSANFYFLDKAFSSNPTVPYPGSGMTAAAQLKPTPWMYIDGGINNANGKTTTMGIESFFDEHEFLSFIEAALTPTIEGVGAGRYRVAFWHIDARENAGKPSDRGITVSCDQDIGDALTVFARYGNADGDVSGITNSVQGGAGIKHVLGKDSLFGLAAAWSQPKDDTLRDEKVVEAFQRFQITETMQFTLDAELIIDPSNAPGDDVLGVFSARLRISF